MEEAVFKFISTGEPTEASECLKQAYELIKESNLKAKWISSQESMKIESSPGRRCIYIVDPFAGPHYEKLKSLECQILGPRCIQECLDTGKPLPDTSKHPVYNTCMRGLVVTCSNVDKKIRKDLHQKIQLMGGEVSKNLTPSITHLVTAQVGSKKYHVACELKKHVMLPEWVLAIWEKTQNEYCHASHDTFGVHRCPVFKGLFVCVTQIDITERNRMKKLIEANGGTYSGNLQANLVTHLITLEPTGQKYSYAKQWKIPCVRPTWLYDSLKLGFCANEAFHELEKNPRSNVVSSTPVSSNKVNVTLSNLSAISISSRGINETALSSVNMTQEKSLLETTVEPRPPDGLETLDLSGCKLTYFLDGCKLYVEGFEGSQLEKLRRIINIGGATKYGQLTDDVSHVIATSSVKDSVFASVTKKNLHPFIVSHQWLVRCFETGARVDEAPYVLCKVPKPDDDTLVDFPNESENKTDENKTALLNQMNNDDDEIIMQYANVQNATKVGNENDKSSHLPNAKSHVVDNEDDVLMQYANVQDVDAKVLATDEPFSTSNMETKLNGDEDDGQEAEAVDDESLNLTEIEPGLLAGLAFRTDGFIVDDDILIKEMILENGGKFLTAEIEGDADYVIVPLIQESHQAQNYVGEVVTNCWLQICLEYLELFPVSSNRLFVPVQLDPKCSPLSKCVITFSQYLGTERDALSRIAKLLGAHCQEYLSRKASDASLKPNTHLVCCQPEGSKYHGARNWGLKIVSKDWLFACAQEGRLVSEDAYSVDKTCEGEKKIATNSAVNGYDKKTLGVNAVVLSTKIADAAKKKRNSIEELRKVFYSIKTPKPKMSRINKLIEDDKSSPSVPTPPSAKKYRTSPDSYFDNPNWRPKFNFTGLLKQLDEEEDESVFPGVSSRRRSIPFDELYHQNITQALQNVKAKFGDPFSLESLGNSSRSDDASSDEASGILKGVVAVPSKKIRIREQQQLKAAIVEMGGECMWHYSQSCTHFLLQGNIADDKDAKVAQNDKKIVVSPEWVTACKGSGVRVDESLYPSTYNANKTLDIVIPRSTPKLHFSATPKSATKLNFASTPRSASRVDLTPKYFDHNVSSSSQTEATTNDDVVYGSEEGQAGKPVLAIHNQISKMLCVNRSEQKSLSASAENEPPTPPVGSPKTPTKLIKSPSKITKSPSTITKSPSTDSSGSPSDESVPKPTVGVSQSVSIVWDDPVGRWERDRISDHLCKESQQILGLQLNAANVGDCEKVDANPIDKHETKEEEPVANVEEVDEQSSDEDVTEVVEKVGVVEEVPAVPRPPPKVMFSGLSARDRLRYASIVKKLGGVVSLNQNFDETSTHLVILLPSRNEKFLASVASGFWILHQSYLDACERENRFLNEEPFEWGFDLNASFCQSLNGQIQKMALSAHTWRKRLQNEVVEDGEPVGAFRNWKVIVYSDEMRTDSFQRILCAGGAVLANSTFPFTKCKGVTHAFLELSRTRNPNVDFDALKLHEVKCIKADFIGAYLIDNEQDTEAYITPEVVPEAIPEDVPAPASSSDEANNKRKPTKGLSRKAKRSKP